MANWRSADELEREGQQWSAGGVFRNTWQKMNDWGDEFERRHFDGNLVESIVAGPKRAGQAMNEWGDELERRHFEGDFLGRVARAPVAAGEVISEAIGQLVDTSPMTPELAAELAAGGMGMDMPSLLASLPPEPEAPAREERSHLEPGEMPGAATPSESSSGPSGASGQRSAGGRTVDELATLMASLPDGGIEDVARDLQAQLEEEQAKRAGRAEALRALKAALLRLPRETAEEQSLADAAAGTCAASTARCGAAGRALQALKEHHQQLKEQHEAQLEEREQLGAAEAAARAAVERQAQLATAPSREWARDGPETDALKASKVELAELLAEVDEARLHRRKELKALQQAVEATEVENQWLRRGGHDCYEAPPSFGASLKKLFSVALGKRNSSAATPTGT
ncbi:unnamed protein product [Effrenium voratum]|uniref:Uncharacterized protein n=1 Tax=Effrenium voratum TaxID=2562239 RepID=A0AA36MZ99_9DINO|nr:unnamed protein product [Effrenium voratum]CAJ1425976.1 unnamed protein product [Effrenium voratum]